MKKFGVIIFSTYIILDNLNERRDRKEKKRVRYQKKKLHAVLVDQLSPKMILTLLLNLLFLQTSASIYPTATINLGTKTKPDSLFRPWHLQITYPVPSSSKRNELPNKMLPIYLFVSGFGGQYDITKYSQVLSEISSHGYVVIGIDRKFKLQAVINYTQLAESLGPVLEYIHNNKTFSKQLTNCIGIPDSTHLIVGGHSAGNHIVIRRLTNFFSATNASSVVMIDPVDGEDVGLI